MYADPYDLYGRLVHGHVPRVRLVVDTGHERARLVARARRWPYMREHLMESDTQIETRVAALLGATSPGRPSPTRWAAARLRELRRQAEAALGPRFDVRRFHECILGSGSLPLATLGSKVDGWITAERDRKAAR